MSIPQIDPAQAVQAIASTPTEQLAEGMRGELRGPILDEVFGRMEEHLKGEQARGVDAVVLWRITGRPDGEADLYQVVIRDGRCEVTKEATAEPRVTLTIEAADFLKLVTGNVAGPELFMAGKLRLEGDLGFAATLP